ncbi:hypothetical protein D3C76_1583700 [compost metagenome]
MGLLYEIIHQSNKQQYEKKSFSKLLVDKVISVSSGTADRKLREYMLQEKASTHGTGTSMI